MPGTVAARRVVEWLEGLADAAYEAGAVQPLDDPAYRWAYTTAVRGTVSADFPLFNGLDEVEVRAEGRLAREVWRLVRAGRCDDAEELCRRVGQSWRAAVIGGGKGASEMAATGVRGEARRVWRSAARALAMEPDVPSFERAVCGVLAGVLEPALAVAESHEDRVWARLAVAVDTATERSLTGRAGVKSMAGRVEGLAEDGEEMDVAVEEGIEGMEAAARAVDVSYTQILDAFRESKGLREGVESVPGEVLACVRRVRGYIALGENIPSPFAVKMLEELALLGNLAGKLHLEWACRFAAHVALFAKKAGLVKKSGAAGLASFESIMVSYATLAIDQEVVEEESPRNAHTFLPIRPIMYDLVARHLSELESVDRLAAVYTKVMASALRGDLRQEKCLVAKPGAVVPQIHDRRTLCLQKAGKCFGAKLGRDALNQIAIASVDAVWLEHLKAFSGSDWTGDRSVGGRNTISASTPSEYDEMSLDDEHVVRAIEFLIFPAFSNYEEALRRATTAARLFFIGGKRAAARHVVEWFPADVLTEIDDSRCINYLHELDCWRAYMAAVSRHSDWRSYFFSQRPAPISADIRAAAQADPGKVSYEVQAAANIRLEAYTKQMENYASISESARDAAVDALRAALLHAGGWMRDLDDETSPSVSGVSEDFAEKRRREVEAVRKVGIPELCALLHHVLDASGLYGEATELATIVADDSMGLYKTFTRPDLGAFLQKIARSAVMHADACINGCSDGGERAEYPYPGQFFEELPVGVKLQR